MKLIVAAFLFLLPASSLVAQTETFDLVTYTPPKGWTKNLNNNSISYTAVDESSNTWCQVGIMKSTTSKGGIEKDFESEWQDLVVRNYKPTESPQLNEVQEKDGWKIKTGIAKFTFNNSDALATLVTMSGNQRCVSIVASTNSEDYLEDIRALISSIVLEKLETGSGGIEVATAARINNPSAVTGTWGVSMVVPYRMGTEGTAGYNIRQYTFNPNGTYTFYAKVFTYSYDELLLVRESGIFRISENMLTIDPKKSVLESWSKKDGTDKWDKLVTAEPRGLEKSTYQFTKQYFSGIQEWNLILQANAETKRDGRFANSPSFTNAWLYSPVSDDAIIHLPN